MRADIDGVLRSVLERTHADTSAHDTPEREIQRTDRLDIISRDLAGGRVGTADNHPR